ncbi:pyridoxamine 5'-phosphate oxidase family protein [Candidatus Altiarchaeota archaeon]
MEELEDIIKDYIESHNICTIAITDGINPSAHSMYYISQGLHVYMESDPQSQKLAILKANPRISVTIDEDYDDWRNIKGVEIYGRVKFTDEKHSPKLQKAFKSKFRHINELGGIPDHHVFIEVVPEKIYFMDFTEKFGGKKVLYCKEKRRKISW